MLLVGAGWRRPRSTGTRSQHNAHGQWPRRLVTAFPLGPHAITEDHAERADCGGGTGLREPTGLAPRAQARGERLRRHRRLGRARTLGGGNIRLALHAAHDLAGTDARREWPQRDAAGLGRWRDERVDAGLRAFVPGHFSRAVRSSWRRSGGASKGTSANRWPLRISATGASRATSAASRPALRKAVVM